MPQRGYGISAPVLQAKHTTLDTTFASCKKTNGSNSLCWDLLFPLQLASSCKQPASEHRQSKPNLCDAKGNGPHRLGQNGLCSSARLGFCISSLWFLGKPWARLWLWIWRVLVSTRICLGRGRLRIFDLLLLGRQEVDHVGGTNGANGLPLAMGVIRSPKRLFGGSSRRHKTYARLHELSIADCSNAAVSSARYSRAP